MWPHVHYPHYPRWHRYTNNLALVKLNRHSFPVLRHSFLLSLLLYHDKCKCVNWSCIMDEQIQTLAELFYVDAEGGGRKHGKYGSCVHTLVPLSADQHPTRVFLQRRVSVFNRQSQRWQLQPSNFTLFTITWLKNGERAWRWTVDDVSIVPVNRWNTSASPSELGIAAIDTLLFSSV